VRRLLSILSASARLAAGSLAFAATGRTPASAYQSMIRLFMLTGGRSNDLAARWVSLLHPPRPLAPANGVLGALGAGRLKTLDEKLRTDGYALFERALAEDLCDRLLQFALTQTCKVRPMDAGSAVPAESVVYDRSRPRGIIYDFHPQALIHNPDIQRLMADASILALAQSYLGAKPVLDTVNLWWTTAFGAKPDSSAAQLWHFDMDRLRWVKFFIYLTDVTRESGPHCFVAGSQRTGGIPQNLRDLGYARITDDVVDKNYPRDAIKEFTAPRGSILVEDTRGLHKGKPVLRGDRLMLEFEFSNSLFGGTPVHEAHLQRFCDPAFETYVRSRPRLFQRWLAK
jgi:hypothetical protein